MRHRATTSAVLAPVLVALFVSGCASLTSHDAAPGAAAPAHTQVATPAAHDDAMAQRMQAQFALQHDNKKAATAAYARAMALSDDPNVARRAAMLAMATDNPVLARRAIARWAKLGATDAQLAAARAQLALGTGDTRSARKHLEKLIASDDKNTWRDFGRVLMSGRDPAQAGQLLQSIATPERLPSDPMAWLAMSELGAKLGRHAYARKLATAAVERFHCAECYAWSAELESRIGHDQKARSLYAKAVKKAPDDTRLRLAYASWLGKAGDNTAAARVMAAGPQDAASYQARAAYAARAHDKAALQGIYDELKNAPEAVRSQSLYLLGQLAITLQQPDAALDWFSKVPLDSKHRFDADMQRVFLLQHQGKTDRALDLVQQMRMDYADDAQHLHKVVAVDAALLISQKRYQQAIAAYNHALSSAPNNTDLLYGRGIAYAQAGNIDAAVADFRRVLKIKPGDVNALNALGFTLADANRDLDEAKDLVARARAARPHDPAITDSWGWVQYRLGHLDAAEKALQKAWKTGKDPEVGGHLAEVLWKQGKTHAARRVLAAARKLAPDNTALRMLARKIAP